MKRLSMIVAVLVMSGLVSFGANVWTRQGPGNQKIGFGTEISETVTDSIAVGSSKALCKVSASEACQIGSGTNDEEGSLQYRSTKIVDGDGALGYGLFGLMNIKYSFFLEDWYEAGGYVANGATTNVTGGAVYGAKFSETAGRGTWTVTVVDGDTDNAETISIMNDERNGVLKLLPNNKANDSIQAQMQGESVKLRSGYTSAFNTRFLVSETNAIVRVGLHLTGTTAAIGTPGTDYIGFYVTNSASGSVCYFQSAKDSSATNLLVSSVVNTAYDRFSFGIVGTDCVVMANGGLIATIPIASGVIPDDEALSPVMAVQDTTTGQAYLKMDYIGVMQTRE